MAAADVRRIARRVAFKQLHIAKQARARIAAFQQVMAKYPVVGKTVLQRGFERIHVVDALADE
ncbi:hypothetical protein D3C72_709010 [compost metagenome]